MTTDEIVAGIDRSLDAIAVERERLMTARERLVGSPTPPAQGGPTRRRRARPTARRGGTLELVLNALDPTEARTAGDVEKLTGVERKLAGATLTRLLRQALITKAERGYLRAA